MSELEVPLREPDHISKRGIPYFWAPEWVRILNGKPSKIRPIKEKGDVSLYMESKDGNLTYIQGSIQKEFKQWHIDRQVDYILLGVDPEEILTVSREETKGENK